MENRSVKGQIGVVGGGSCSPDIYELACEVGVEIAKRGYRLVCGGLAGVMEAACRGAREAGGITIGILPGVDKQDANPFVDVIIPTGLGHARNILVVHASDALIAIDGGAGTLSEIAIALKVGKPVVGIRTWDLEGKVIMATRGREAVALATKRLTG